MSVGEDGPLPDGWRWAPLGDVAGVVAGQSPPSETYRDEPEGFAFFQGKADFGSRYPTARKWCVQPTKIAKRGDILVSVRAPVGPTNVADQDCCIGRGLAALRTKDSYDRNLLLHIMRWREPNLVRLGSGSSFQAITTKQLENVAVPVPPLPEQRRIADLLDAAMKDQARAGVAALAQLNDLARTRDAYLSGVFAAQSGRWPMRSIASCVQEFRNGFGRRPVGEEQGPIVLRIADVSGGSVDLSSPRRIAMDADERRTYALTERDVLLIRVNGSLDLVGRCVIVPPSDEPLCYNDHLMRARVATDVVPAYLALIANFSDARSQLTAAAVTSAGQKTVNQQMLARVFVPVPARPEQERLLADLSRVQQRIATAQAAATAQLAAIDALPGALLAAAFRGDL